MVTWLLREIGKSKIRTPQLGAVLLFVTAAPAFAGTLHPGDKIVVTVYNHPELSANVTIDAGGNISLPVAGTVQARNVDPDALAKQISDRLAPYVRQVAVQVRLETQSDSIFIAGGPGGVLKYRPGETLTSVVDELQVPTLPDSAAAVNPHDTAARAPQNTQLDLLDGPVDFRHVTILRDGKTLGPFDVVALRGAGDPGPALLPDDTIQLVDKPIAVAVRGDVARPGTVYLDVDEPLSQALLQVGGPNATATETQITLTRNGASRQVTIGSPIFSQPAQNGDVLTFPRAPRVDVLGTVEKPGSTSLRGDATLVAALYYAGGPAAHANLKSVQVIHDGRRKTYDLAKLQKGDTGENPTLVDGDVVFVPQGSTFDWSQIWQAIGALGLFGLHI
jgi:protein involved in polysaccharide export with SLBB domain